MEGEMKNLIKREWMCIGFCLVIAFAGLMICSRSSFLYPYNDWNDANSYFTMGKGMMNGLVIYRDLYDQKGPYLYLLYGIAYLISHTTFRGVFLLEILAIGSFLYICSRIMGLYMSRRWTYFLLPILEIAVLTSKSFYFGGAAEEFCLPLLAGSLYLSIRWFKDHACESPRIRKLFYIGLMAGVVMLVKYTMLGLYAGLMLMMAGAFLGKRDIKGLFKGCGGFLAGMLLPVIPWLIYFGWKKGLSAWYECYIYNNIFFYSNFEQEALGIGQRIYELCKLLLWLFVDNPFFFGLILIGMFFLLVSKQFRWFEKLNIIVMAGLLFLGIYVGGSNLPYYAIPLTVFAVTGLLPFGRLLDRIGTGEGKRLPYVMTAVCVVLCMGLSYRLSMNTPFMQQSKEEYFLTRFQKIVEEEENSTLLNIGCLDAGLYTAADIIPNCRFFQTNGIGLQEMFREQERYMEEGRIRFVLSRDDGGMTVPDHYELAAQEQYQWDGKSFVYSLYQLRE